LIQPEHWRERHRSTRCRAAQSLNRPGISIPCARLRAYKESTLQIAPYWLGSNSGRVKRHPKTEYFCVFTRPRPSVSKRTTQGVLRGGRCKKNFWHCSLKRVADIR
jgi:hypothetical protein